MKSKTLMVGLALVALVLVIGACGGNLDTILAQGRAMLDTLPAVLRGAK